MTNLTICQECKENPAIYGDGITWSRCSACEMNYRGEQVQVPSPQEGMQHTIKEGLVSVILPVYMNDYALFHYTGNCIGALREHTPENSFELIVIDNGSPVKVPSPNSFYADKVIQNQENLGVTHAWNQGIRVSQGEYIVLLNNDVQVFDHWLEDMKAALKQYDLVMAHPMYSLTEPFARAKESARIRKEVLEREVHFSTFKDFSCVMFKRDLINELGTFDEEFFNYCSDSDFFDRMESAGKKWACCEAVATSHLSDATGYSIPETPDIMNKDKATYAAKSAGKVEPVIEKIEIQLPYRLVRTKETGDAMFYIHNGKYHHVANPETLNALGLQFGDEKMISYTVLATDFEKGEVISIENYKEYV